MRYWDAAHAHMTAHIGANDHLLRLLRVVKQLHQPAQGCQQAWPGVGAAHRKQRRLADLEWVLQLLEQRGHIILNLAKGFDVGIHLAKQELQGKAAV